MKLNVFSQIAFLENERPLYQFNEKWFLYELCNHWTSF